MLRTIGAAQKNVIPLFSNKSRITGGSTLRKQTWVAPAAVMAQIPPPTVYMEKRKGM